MELRLRRRYRVKGGVRCKFSTAQQRSQPTVSRIIKEFNMNIEVVGKIQPLNHGEGPQMFQIDGLNRLSMQSGGTFMTFSEVYQQQASNEEIFSGSVRHLVDLFLNGYNVCMLVLGETGSGKSQIIGGSGSLNMGIVPQIFEDLFDKILAERSHIYGVHSSQDEPVVTLQMYELYNELIKELLVVPTGHSVFLDLDESAERAVYIRNGNTAHIRNVTEARSIFNKGWARRTISMTDYGPVCDYATILIQINLQMQIKENLQQSIHSRFTIVELPGLEKLSDTASQLHLREGPVLSRALLAMDEVITTLASYPTSARVVNYSGSKLTQFLKEEIGGNCKTRAILCLKPSSVPRIQAAVLRFASNLSKVVNYPVVNDSLMQALLVQYHAVILDLKQQLGLRPAQTNISSVQEMKDKVRNLQTENIHLNNQNERMQYRLNQLQNRFGNLTTTKTDISHQLLMTEEEKLMVSQSLVELQIEKNRLQEEAEATKFELTNKILILENSLVEMETKQDREAKAAKNAKDMLSEIEKDRRNLADDYIILKTNYSALTKEHQKEVTRNEELSIELLNLVNSKAVLKKQLKMHRGGSADASAEVERIRDLVTKNASLKHRADEILGAQQEREAMQMSLFADQRRFQEEMERMRTQYEEESVKMERKLAKVLQELDTSRHQARRRQHRLSELGAKLITLRNEKEQMETQNNRLQNKIKMQEEDYRSRLIRYLQDVAAYVDTQTTSKSKGVEVHSTHMQDYVEQMMRDIKKSHRQREEQLSQAAQSFRVQMKQVVRKHEELLVAYRNLRNLCKEHNFDEAEMGPSEHSLHMTDLELASVQQREIDYLGSELRRALVQLEALKQKVQTPNEDRGHQMDAKAIEREADKWAMLHKQLRQFTLTTQQQLESERAELITNNQVLQGELKETQDYIDKHLIKYKDEIIKLQRLFGKDYKGSFQLTPEPWPRGRQQP